MTGTTTNLKNNQSFNLNSQMSIFRGKHNQYSFKFDDVVITANPNDNLEEPRYSNRSDKDKSFEEEKEIDIVNETNFKQSTKSKFNISNKSKFNISNDKNNENNNINDNDDDNFDNDDKNGDNHDDNK